MAERKRYGEAPCSAPAVADFRKRNNFTAGEELMAIKTEINSWPIKPVPGHFAVFLVNNNLWKIGRISEAVIIAKDRVTGKVQNFGYTSLQKGKIFTPEQVGDAKTLVEMSQKK